MSEESHASKVMEGKLRHNLCKKKEVMILIRYSIRVNHGDADVTVKYYFVHRDFASLTDEEQNEAFDMAVKELNRIYKMYGRFATEAGVTSLFRSFGFERTIP